MTPQQYKESQMFKKLMEEQAVDADYPVHEKVKADDHLQKTFGNKYINHTAVEKASAWMSQFLGNNNPHKEH